MTFRLTTFCWGWQTAGKVVCSGLSCGHMGGMRLRKIFDAESGAVTWRCGDCTVSKETYCVANNLTGVWRIAFQPQRPLRQILTPRARSILPDSPHAPHRSALHVTTPVETLPIKNVTSTDWKEKNKSREEIFYQLKVLFRSVVRSVFSCDQAALWMIFSVRLTVCHTFLTMTASSYHHEILLLPMTKVRSMQKVKVRGQMSTSQRSQPNLTVSGL